MTRSAARPADVVVTPFTCGWLTLPVSFFLADEPGEIIVPVPAYLIEHPRGLALFDTGLGPRFSRPSDTPFTGPADLEEHALIDARLRSAGIAPDTIRYIVNSHLHGDHAGGNALISEAAVVVQRAEWDAAHAGIDDAYYPPDFETDQELILVDGEHDLFDDGSVVLIPTPGHTPGHQSARVRTRGVEIVLCGDACCLLRSLTEKRVPDHGDDLTAFRDSLDLLQGLRDDGATIFYGHDPDFWATLAKGVRWQPGHLADRLA